MRSVPAIGTRVAPSRRTWRTIGASLVAAAFFAMTLAVLSSGLGLVDAARWAAAQQRAFHEMVQQLLAHRGGAWASLSLVGACFGYGVLHAAVPGHGKFVVAGAGIASRISTLRLVALSAAGSLAQAVTAIVLVYGSFATLSITAGSVTDASRYILEPLSTVVIVAIGIVLVRRAVMGFRSLWAPPADGVSVRRSGRARDPHLHDAHNPHGHDLYGYDLNDADGQSHRHDGHDPAGDDGRCGCGHRHGPTLDETDAIATWRDAAMLIASIGLRPCTGAVFVLAAAWRMDLVLAGAAAAVAMAVGTGLVVSSVAVSAASARGATLFAAGRRHAGLAAPVLQLVAGSAIILVGIALLVAPVVG